VKFTSIQFKGGGPAAQSLLAGDTQVMFATPPTVMGFIKAGRMRVIAYNGATRAGILPDVPTLAEAGVPGTVIDGSWYGMFAPPHTPEAIIARLVAEVRGAGMIIGIVLKHPAKAVVDACFGERLVVNGTADNVLRLLPPLILTREEADAGLAIIERALRTGASANA
jgi:hypothetical protein